ncbi:7-carboxy-7-deazaguanine synthase [Ampullimonas aquatilis]|uniref:7-carboxy-7-deazaguanine synthase n=1 Tax=Ampullimonas aquatilis TaxID=1341549 RepID=UPI003C738869
MTYSVKEMFYTLQGEGAQAGRPAVFCRFAGCNLWTGREADRANAICQFCDTDFVGTDGVNGGKFVDAMSLAQRIASFWPAQAKHRYVVCTGGEPLLQLDAVLIDALHSLDFEIAVETNGTVVIPAGIDWVCVSPKANAALLVERGNELKVVFPQSGQNLAALEKLNFKHYFVQPMDGPDQAANTQAAVEFCKAHPQWRLSLQTHKLIAIP